MKILIKFKHAEVRATLADTPAARDFASLLPLKLKLSDYASTEKVADLPRRLSTAGEPAGAKAAVGDITYYAPWGNLAIFYKPFGHSQGLVHLGAVDDGMRAFNFDGMEAVTIEREP